MNYDNNTAVDEPIEIRMGDVFGNQSTYLGTARDGVVHHSWIGASGHSESMSNAQRRGSSFTYPRKAMPGWQAEVLAYFTSSMKTVKEVR